MYVRRHFSIATQPTALTIGNFDGVHLGHQAMLARTVEAARRLGVESCALTFEPHPREFFAPDQAPARLTTLREKLAMFERAGVTRAQVCHFDYRFAQMSAEDFIAQVIQRGLHARWLLVGEDFRFGARRAGDITLLKQAAQNAGFEVDVMPAFEVNGERVSSTAIRAALEAGDMQHAQRLLGRPYAISGRVVRNNQLGRALGFPTANIPIRQSKTPARGIFAVEAQLDDERLRGVASLGVRPTIANNLRPMFEVHLFDFDRDIYGAHLRVELLHKFRDEEKYADIKTLQRQIALDVENAKNYFSRQDAMRAKRTRNL